jgi:hypothetical protein
MSVTITVSTELFEHLQNLEKKFEDNREPWMPTVGLSTSDAYYCGFNYGTRELASDIIESYEANKIQG